MPTDVLIIGAGGHSKVVVEACLLSQAYSKLLIADESLDKVGTLLLGKYPIHLLNTVDKIPQYCHIAIGNNCIRQTLFDRINRHNTNFASIIHPKAVISISATVSSGCFIAAGVIVSSATIISDCCIINHGAVVDHDCFVGCFSHIAPNATLCGGVKIGRCVLIGAGSVVLPNISIQDNAVIGAGAVVTSNVSEGETVMGIPGTAIKNIRT
ncbi:acetyltransferase [Candidatus Sororendozoicomonas aggregata]|uniref:acetyltransferase n=1 Tax=Candidatus Sororendozoicomonas aggregata TaxID=3073239 RepID=UPI002ED6B5DB